MINKLLIVVFLNLSLGFYGCLTAGTHGSIKSYQYIISKSHLENGINEILRNNKNIQRDTAKDWNDSTKNDYYNDGQTYITIVITERSISNTYTFRYGGDKEYWDTSKNSFISIAYAYDKNGNGGSEGNGGFPWYKFGLKKKFTKLFEDEFIRKVDSLLGQKHIDIE
ncbi:MAG: hypothetical protein ABIQ31_05560 [Ferruginibacter sp.]